MHDISDSGPEKRPLHPYIVHDGEPSEGAVLAIAHTAKEARRLGYPEISNFTGAEWIDVKAERLRLHRDYLLSLSLKDEPHCIIDPPTCSHCEMWGAPALPGGGCETCGGGD